MEQNRQINAHDMHAINEKLYMHAVRTYCRIACMILVWILYMNQTSLKNKLIRTSCVVTHQGHTQQPSATLAQRYRSPSNMDL